MCGLSLIGHQHSLAAKARCSVASPEPQSAISTKLNTAATGNTAALRGMPTELSRPWSHTQLPHWSHTHTGYGPGCTLAAAIKHRARPTPASPPTSKTARLYSVAPQPPPLTRWRTQEHTAGELHAHRTETHAAHIAAARMPSWERTVIVDDQDLPAARLWIRCRTCAHLSLFQATRRPPGVRGPLTTAHNGRGGPVVATIALRRGLGCGWR